MMIEKIENLIKNLEDKKIYKSHRFIPYILQGLKKMKKLIQSQDYDIKQLKIIAAGLGRITMDDDAFYRSPIGIEVSKLFDKIYRM
jgi:hypothetical protein